MRIQVLIFLIAILLSVIVCFILIPLLRRIKAGQFILGYVKEHSTKGGTPTMGGLAFILVATIITFIFFPFMNRHVWVAISIMLAYMVVGFLDDFLKIKYKQNLGLKAYQKIIFQVILATIIAVYCYLNGLTFIRIPWTSISLNLSFWIIPIIVFVFLATTNCVNLTDGLDGLAASVSFWYFAAMASLILMTHGDSSLATLCIIMCGVLSGYLLFNTNKASVFMGGTGSLGLGAIIASVSIFSGNMLFIPIFGIMFVLSGISVILQVIHYKRTKKRIFLMAPLHHHFQQKGYSEAKIVYAYSLSTIIVVLCALLFI